MARFAPDQKRGLSLPKLDRVVELIDASLEEGLSLAEMAAAVHLSPIHFARMFRRSTGVSPHQYLINRRVLRAKDGLLRGDTPIAEIAQRCGFSNQEHLTRTFGRIVGITPAA